MSIDLARQLLSLLITCALVLAPVTGALALVPVSESSHSAAHAHCPETALGQSGASSDANNTQATDNQSQLHCCDLPCGQCGHCPGLSLPSHPPVGTESRSISFTSLPGTHAGYTPERIQRPPRSL